MLTVVDSAVAVFAASTVAWAASVQCDGTEDEDPEQHASTSSTGTPQEW